eukprot:8199913-Pyramimonas_sp.AAC.1
MHSSGRQAAVGPLHPSHAWHSLYIYVVQVLLPLQSPRLFFLGQPKVCASVRGSPGSPASWNLAGIRRRFKEDKQAAFFCMRCKSQNKHLGRDQHSDGC